VPRGDAGSHGEGGSSGRAAVPPGRGERGAGGRLPGVGRCRSEGCGDGYGIRLQRAYVFLGAVLLYFLVNLLNLSVWGEGRSIGRSGMQKCYCRLLRFEFLAVQVGQRISLRRTAGISFALGCKTCEAGLVLTLWSEGTSKRQRKLS